MAKQPLWDVFDGEPFLDNPHLAVLTTNPRKRKSKRSKKMARRLPKRDSKGRFIKRGRAASTRRRAKRRTVGVRTGAFGRKVRRVRVAKHPVLVNPRRRRRSTGRRKYAYVMNRRRRSYRRNPVGFKSIFSKPTLKNVGFAVVGLAGTPMVVGFAQRYLPAMITANKWGMYAVKAGSAWALSWGTTKVAGKEAGRSVLIGGLAYVAMGMIQDFFPTVLSLGASSGTGRYLSSARKQPLLAEYMSGARGAITASTPSRLDPAGRF